MSALRLFAFLFAFLSFASAFAQEPEPGYDPNIYPQDEAQPPPMPEQPPLPPPPQANPAYDEHGYVPRSMRARQAPTPMRLPVSAAMPASFFAGHWGQVAFNNENDLQKMIPVARSYCNLPVNIALASQDTFKMYVTTELKEVQLFEQNGSLFIIPVEQFENVPIRGARELHIIDNNTFTLRYLEEDAHRHYGPNVFVRCGAARAAAKTNSEDETPAPVKKKKRISKKPE